MTEEEKKQLREKVLAGWSTTIPPKSVVNYILKHVITIEDLETNDITPPQIKRLNEIKELLSEREESMYQEAMQNDDPAKKLIFLRNFPKSKYAQDFLKDESAMDDAEWEEASKSPTKESLEKYKNLFPNGKYINKCNTLLDDLPFLETLSQNTIEGFIEYEKKYPDKHTEEIEKQKNSIKDEIAWETAKRNNTVAAYEEYLRNFPNGKHAGEAKDHINNRSTKDIFLDELRNDPNYYSVKQIQEKKENGTISDYNELNDVFDKEQVDAIRNYQSPKPLDPVENRKSERNHIEIYFWGLKGTGKTCVIGSIIGQLTKQGNIYPVPGSPGETYLLQLQNLFNSNERIISLPGGTFVGNLPIMSFGLRDSKNLTHSVSIIDVAGEVFTEIFNNNRNANLDKGAEITDEGKDAADNFMKVLSNNENYKIHFFIMEYGNNDVNNKGISKSQIMNSLAEYFHKTDLFKKKSVGIYLLATKCDRIPEGEDRSKAVKEYIENDNLWNNFYKSIKEKAIESKINDFRILTYSIGKVFAQDLCVFDPTDADKIIEKIITHTHGSKRGLFYKLFSWLDK